MLRNKILVGSIVIIAIVLISLTIVWFYLLNTGKIILRLATTTSVDNTGLLTYLKTYFEAKYPEINLTWVAVGTGQAVEVGKRGDADVILVHNRPLEDQFINESYGIHGITIAYNDFIIVGPLNDPANINSTSSAAEAFERIFQCGEAGGALFISRGDGSGTNLKELEIWSHINYNATGKQWYKETGSGMSSTLQVANQLQGYTLTDRGTWISMQNQLSSLKLLYEGDLILLNTYRVIMVNPDKFSNIKYDQARKFVLFLVSPEGQNLIGNYTKSGLTLFNPVFGKLNGLGIYDSYEDEQVAYWTNELKNAG